MTTTAPHVAHRPANARGTTRLGWLNSRHSFSFGNYHDPERMGYHGLRVLNDDRVGPGMGFDPHPHRDMEILTWVLDGKLAHKDSMGHASTLGPGSIQLMSAGTGVTHSEFNASADAPVHFLQVWIMPRGHGTEPRYQEATPDPAGRAGRFTVLADPGGADGALVIGADARVHVGDFPAGSSDTLKLPNRQVAYVHVATGHATINGQPAAAGDAVTIEGHPRITVEGTPDAAEPTQVLAFILPA